MNVSATPLDVALAYHRAWTTGDLETAMTLIADDVVFDAPPGQLTGVTELRAFMEPFSSTLSSSRLLAAYGGEHDALIMYDTANPAVTSAPAAELHEVHDGKIISGRIIFDRLPFAMARGEVVKVER